MTISFDFPRIWWRRLFVCFYKGKGLSCPTLNLGIFIKDDHFWSGKTINLWLVLFVEFVLHVSQLWEKTPTGEHHDSSSSVVCKSCRGQTSVSLSLLCQVCVITHSTWYDLTLNAHYLRLPASFCLFVEAKRKVHFVTFDIFGWCRYILLHSHSQHLQDKSQLWRVPGHFEMNSSTLDKLTYRLSHIAHRV